MYFFQISLTPNSAWGGEGCLGCDIGYGYLHRIPGDRRGPLKGEEIAAMIKRKSDDSFTAVPSVNTGNSCHSGTPTTSNNTINIPQPGVLQNLSFLYKFLVKTFFNQLCTEKCV